MSALASTKVPTRAPQQLPSAPKRKDSLFSYRPCERSQQLENYDSLTKLLPDGPSDDVRYWWAVTGKHFAIMLSEAGYSSQKQTEMLLLYRFTVIPHLGRKPASPNPHFRSAVAQAVGDGSPICYRWSWGTARSKPQIFLTFEPIGPLSGTMADPLNENAAKGALLELSKIYPDSVDLSLLWTFAEHLRPFMKNALPTEPTVGVMLLGLHCKPDSGITARLSTHAPKELPNFFAQVFPQALQGVYGADVFLEPLAALHHFVSQQPAGRKLTILGTTGVDCLSLEEARVKCHAVAQDTSLDFIETVLTLGGTKTVSKKALARLRALLTDFREGCCTSGNSSQRRNSAASNSGMSFIFEINASDQMPEIRLELDVSKHAASPFNAVQAVSAFLTQRGQGRDAQAYMNVLHGILGEPRGAVSGSREEEINSWRGLQGSFTFSIEKDDISIMSTFLPLCYRRYRDIQLELESVPQHQRRSLFD